jgi:hypothetical protein
MQRRNWNGIRCISLFGVIGCLLVVSASGQTFHPYPGATVDEAAGKAASAQRRGFVSEVYTSTDSFDKIYAFYKQKYKEVPTPFPTQTLPSGENVRWAFFLLDSGQDLAHSRFWIKIQRPYIGTLGNSLDYGDIRNLSVIQTVHQK